MSENKVLHFLDYANMKSEDVEKKEEFVQLLKLLLQRSLTQR